MITNLTALLGNMAILKHTNRDCLTGKALTLETELLCNLEDKFYNVEVRILNLLGELRCNCDLPVAFAEFVEEYYNTLHGV